MCACAHVYVCVCMYMCVCECVHVYVCVCVNMCLCVCVSSCAVSPVVSKASAGALEVMDIRQIDGNYRSIRLLTQVMMK